MIELACKTFMPIQTLDLQIAGEADYAHLITIAPPSDFWTPRRLCLLSSVLRTHIPHDIKLSEYPSINKIDNQNISIHSQYS